MAVVPVGPDGCAKAPVLDVNEKLEAAWLVCGDGKKTELRGALDVSEQMRSGQPIRTADGETGRVLMAFIQSPTGMQVKRPGLGAEGPVLDHLDREALEKFLAEVGDKLISATKGSIRAIHSDSLEVYGQNWTGSLLDEFSKRRGYDLKPYLPALVSDIGPLTADVRHDFWRTVTELALDGYVRPLHEWAVRHGVGVQAESYGTPPVDLTSYANIDYPMGEGRLWKVFGQSRWASSAAHQYGRPVTSAETYTWLRHPRYVSTLQDVKAASDLYFACGINKLVGHGFAYSPPATGVPGWDYYASILMNDKNPWWPYFPRLSDYVRRTSYALTLGKPLVDIALYLPEEDAVAAYAADRNLGLSGTTMLQLRDRKPLTSSGHQRAYVSEAAVVKTIITSGYSFDGFDRSILQPGLKTSGGRLEVGDVAYRIAVLPNLKGITLPILEKLVEFCRSGGILIATRRLPEAAYGLKNREENYARVRTLVSSLFGAGAPEQTRRNRVGRGLAIYVPDDTTEFARILASLGPEIRLERPDDDLVFLHRGEGDRQIYFLANTSGESKTFRATFRDGRGRPQFWDAMTGDIRLAPWFTARNSGTEVPLHLEPLGSTIVAFDGTPGSAPVVATDLPLSEIRFDPARRAWTAHVTEPGSYFVQTSGGKTQYQIGPPAPPIPVTGPWSLRVGEEAPVRLDTLGSWTELSQYCHFAGRGDYEVEVEMPDVGHDGGFWLDLGEVREIADVKINGQPAGVCWKSPYHLDISPWIRAGRNVISVGVTNVLINRVLGQPDHDYSALEPLRFPVPSEKRMVPSPAPSGLLGPVRIIPYTIVEIR